MPSYCYACSCGNEVTKFKKMISSEEDIEQCEKCGKEMKRKISSAPVHYKGSGFYTTDYSEDKKES